MRPPPTTAEYVETLAYLHPAKPALREDDLELNYGQLHAMLVHCARELDSLGVRAGQRVAVSGPGLALQLVLLIAAEGLGAVTASFQAEGDADADALFGLVDWVLSSKPQQVPATARFVLIDQAFADRLAPPLPRGERRWVAPPMHQPQRIARTSGSTGRSKFMLLHRAAQELWVQGVLPHSVFRPQTRFLLLAPLVMNVAFTRCARCLRAGGLVIAGGGERIAEFAPTDIWGLPAHLERLLDAIPPGYARTQDLFVDTAGGALPPALLERVSDVLGATIVNRYGTNEVGAVIERLDEHGVGLLAAGAEVRIEGPGGELLPDGEEGTIVVRTPYMATGYLNAPEASAQAFRDGWFVTADVGALVGPRHLRLAGRQDDQVNVGGLKMPAYRVEAQLRSQPAIADCAVLAVLLDGGLVQLGVAVVPAPGHSGAEAIAQVASGLPAPVPVRALALEALPRLDNGKLDRMRVLRLLREAR